MTTFSSKVIADSVNPYGSRLTTMVWTYPRYVHAQIMTHRAFSRNSASSRAVPTEKLLARIEEDPVVPDYWGKLKSGMQAVEELSGKDLEEAKALWEEAKQSALGIASKMLKIKLHKQNLNRLLEPFLHNTLVVTATEVSNFFHLRDHGDTQHETQRLARAARLSLSLSKPRKLEWGDWHLPFVLPDDGALLPEDGVKISSARCARVSFFNHEGVKDKDGDFKLYSRLVDREDWGKNPIHASATEHPARARDPKEIEGISWLEAFETSQISNFHPTWLQHRKTLVGENIPTERVDIDRT